MPEYTHKHTHTYAFTALTYSAYEVVLKGI